MTLAGIVARLDRLPVSRFHFVLLVVGAASLFFDTLDGLVMTFVLSNLRTVWTIDVAIIGMVSATGFAGYLVGAAACGFIADRIGRRTTILLTLVLYSLVLRSARPGGQRGDPGSAALSDIHLHRRREFDRPAVSGGVLAGLRFEPVDRALRMAQNVDVRWDAAFGIFVHAA
jgi:MFS family permease